MVKYSLRASRFREISRTLWTDYVRHNLINGGVPEMADVQKELVFGHRCEQRPTGICERPGVTIAAGVARA